MDDDLPYVIESPTRVRLKPIARELAKEHGMTDEQMARHILQQERLRAAGLTQRDGEN
jgi:hypothetical protein